MGNVSELLLATDAATRYLHHFVESNRGYTSQDVQAGIQRLRSLCRELEQTEKPSWQYAQAATAILDAAEMCVEEAQDLLAGVRPE